ncbi:MAG: hypothetical protein H8E90_04580 [Anaerolineales bacterium]|nr:hypothetical protein [Anaerolineales bacterium]
MLERVQDAKTWMVFYLTRWLRPRQWVLLDGLVRGLGRTTFALTEAEGNRDSCLIELIERVDEVIRQAPNPVGIDHFLIRVRVFKRPALGSYSSQPNWRRLLACEFFLDSEEQDCLISHYRDWKHGDAKQRLASLLWEHHPTPAQPLVEVAVTSIGRLLVELDREQRISLRTY